MSEDLLYWYESGQHAYSNALNDHYWGVDPEESIQLEEIGFVVRRFRRYGGYKVVATQVATMEEAQALSELDARELFPLLALKVAMAGRKKSKKNPDVLDAVEDQFRMAGEGIRTGSKRRKAFTKKVGERKWSEAFAEWKASIPEQLEVYKRGLRKTAGAAVDNPRRKKVKGRTRPSRKPKGILNWRSLDNYTRVAQAKEGIRYWIHGYSRGPFTVEVQVPGGEVVILPSRVPTLRGAKRKVEEHYLERYPLRALSKVSKKNPRQADVSLYQIVLAYLRALQWVAWTTHWTVKGPSFYGDHLLLQRLYEGKKGGPNINDEIDGLGERMVAYFGPQSVHPAKINKLTQELIDPVSQAGDRITSLIHLEVGLQSAIRKAWSANQSSGEEMSLGLDDFLMGLANERDTAKYLLKQRLG